jgi:hypothetical protein
MGENLQYVPEIFFIHKNRRVTSFPHCEKLNKATGPIRSCHKFPQKSRTRVPLMYSVCPAGCSELLSSLLKLTEDEEDLALIIPGQLIFIYFSAGMRKAVLFFTGYLAR